MHVSHKSITRGPYHSTEKRHFLARATWRLHLDAFHEQHCNLEKDREARASFVIPFAIDHLQLAKGHRVSVGEPIDNARLISITSSPSAKPSPNSVKAYLKSSKYYSSIIDTFPSTNTTLSPTTVNSRVDFAYHL